MLKIKKTKRVTTRPKPARTEPIGSVPVMPESRALEEEIEFRD